MFIFGGDTGVDYQQLQKRRAIADAMMQRSVSGTPKNVGEGLTAIGNAIFGKIADKRLQKKEAAAREDANRLMAALLGGGAAPAYGNPYGGGYAAPAPKPTEAFPTGNTPAPDIMSEPVTARSAADVMKQYDVAENNADPGLGYGQRGEPVVQDPIVQGIIETANALGVDPLDVATVVSYETAGTFDPTKAGPTTQHGRHRGFIQFGEPQAQQFGVDWDDPIRSQLGSDGAIVKYMRQAGVQPGMGLLDLYSAVNAGRVGRYNASDANNGGAPGTVADKVAGMADHRAKAAAFLGGQFNPILDNQPNVMRGPAGPGAAQNMPMPRVAGGNIEQIVQLLSNPYASPAQQMIAQTLLGQSMAQQQPTRGIAVGGRIVNPITGEVIYDAPDGPGSTEFGLNPVFGKDAEGNTVVLQLGKNGEAVATKLPEGVTPDLGVKKFEENRAGTLGKAEGEAVASAPSDIRGAEAALALLDDIRNDDARKAATGASSLFNAIPGTKAYDFQQKVEQAKSGAFLTAIQQLRGMGALSNAEGQTATQAVTRMNTALSEKGFLDALDDYEKVIRRGMEAAQKRIGQQPRGSQAGGPPAGIDPDVWDAMSPEDKALWN